MRFNFRTAMSRRNQNNGFSLIEVLVVVAVVSVLMAMILVGSQKVASAKNSTVCVSNLRTIGGVVMQYVADNNGSFPPSRLQYTRDPVSGSRKTVSFLPDLLNRLYLNHEDLTNLWWCPGDLERPRTMRKWSYGHNQFLGGDKGVSHTWDGLSNPDYDIRYASPLTMEKSPGEVIYLIDFVNTADSGKWSSSISAGSWPLQANDSLHSMRAARIDFSRHNDTANALFLDGSVRGMKFEHLVGTRGRYIHPYME